MRESSGVSEVGFRWHSWFAWCWLNCGKKEVALRWPLRWGEELIASDAGTPEKQQAPSPFGAWGL
ncbi:hypothetical protein Rmet_6538 [Cupriavidus metallidurans CH34]|uniref:Uncharacterized protein n=1 Tax=Cupriavidus metallidurans (strain ATCC 43123 / DSM 2839 / NBRC 102507 / CH34) TaxID=266264 RepID=D3DXX5_CUPMC|nr:hypothetical protein Rmet_6538 [Cupriavidus metallidurans CH34]